MVIDVGRVLSTLDQQLPSGATASWFEFAPAAPDEHGPTDPASTALVFADEPSGAPGEHRAPSGPVRRLLVGLAAVLAEIGGELAEGGTDLLVESPRRTVLVHHVAGAGALVVEAGKGLNLALVRRLVTLTLQDAGEDPIPDEPVVEVAAPPEGGRRAGGVAMAFPRRKPPPPVTGFRFVPEDAQVLRMLEEALSG